MEEKKYLIHKYDGIVCTVLGKTEDELTKSDKDLLLGQLISEFNKYPFCVQSKMVLKFVDACKEKATNELIDKLEKRL